MSEENEHVVRQSIDAWNRRDAETARSLWRDDGEIDWSRSMGPLKGVYRGRAEVEAFRDEFWGTFQSGELEAHGYMSAGSDVVVPNTASLRGRDGLEVTARSTFVFTVEDGLVTRLRMFQERSEALEAVGLSEDQVA